MTLPISRTAEQIAPFRVMKILGQAKALEAQGKDIIHMEIGEPDFPSLACVHNAAMQAAEQGLTHYTPTLGLPSLRNKLAQFYQRFYQAKVPEENIVITPGSSSALQLVLTAILNPSDQVLMADPTYPCNRQFVELLHGKVKAVPVEADTQYQLSPELLEQHWSEEVKAVMVASPANPTGTLIEQDALRDMAQFLSERDSYLIVDEIYQGLVYDRPAESILAQRDLPENVIVINSFSKFFGMTGWRLGWTVAPAHLVDVLDRLGQNLYLSAPTPSQYGALAVLEEDALAELEQRRQIFQQRRDRLHNAMQQAGFNLKTLPQGAFYLYWDISQWSRDSEQFCADLLQATGVAITPGTDFGSSQGNHYVRLAYTNERIEEAVQRIQAFVQTLQA
ncbi:aminotransferase class I/II-fold pyridoxal phosphate-dependent enzyme [Thiomicrorhabdus sp. 6S3-12]|uniref:aminotransferase class I/II-fold pyridoxal phosphate-dependent enzyme n=1 Tax=Thiomicrorhabdus sp. 6S3-12 TaxID=2819681 RepID=UPI001AAE09E1|nr:aminotransferase class I/II-fold pyridoxal phosphate-dependent enzyme [Thiomicrorhabdus sp. 6S3-12]MBO1925084.1 aminotransferase class I/II-fold pyridoxal phosphate-dependent enzyme [Thiomicrorhabdus sp. 6S3-12]